MQRLSELLKERDVRGEVCLLGGTAMVLAFKARPNTKDVDAIFHPPQVIRELVAEVAEELNLPENWLNDGAKGFVSAAHEVSAHDLPQFQNLRIVAPTAEYMFAMKCMAARVAHGDERSDVADIILLARTLSLQNVADAMTLVAKYYPQEQIPIRTQYLLEDVFARINRTSQT
ncbi:MAG: DUF6036 family nucleotidyltransferase [Acidobacteriales bacterium]|nr:DUF6036 family nucleotidyltransferase [Terriglobales bacterium]